MGQWGFSLVALLSLCHRATGSWDASGRRSIPHAGTLQDSCLVRCGRSPALPRQPVPAPALGSEGMGQGRGVRDPGHPPGWGTG